VDVEAEEVSKERGSQPLWQGVAGEEAVEEHRQEHGGGHSTGRQSGLAPSIRRTPSQWEGVSLEAGGPRITATQGSQIGSDITVGLSTQSCAKRTAATQGPRVARGRKRTRGTG